MAHSAFSTFTGTTDGPAGLAFSWHLRRAADLSNAELALYTELSSGRPLEPTLLTEPPSCWAMITETEVNGRCITVALA
ncbi:hypothetical protein AAC387_Pa06g2066 [Persea americana]